MAITNPQLQTGADDGIAISKYHILDTGSCHTFATTLLRGQPWRSIRCHCLVALLHHPKHGWILWDTGYASHIFQATQRFPWRLYRFVTPLYFQPELSIVRQLPGLGLTPDDITHVIVSHLHGDHTAGLRDFPRAKFIVSRAAWEDMRVRKGINALRRASIPALSPEDFAERAIFTDEFPGAIEGALGPTFDLFGDGSLRLFPLPGHARGQLGMLAKISQSSPSEIGNKNFLDGDFLFTADSCLHRASAYTGILPSRLTYLIADDVSAVASSIQRLHTFVSANSAVIVIPTHCPETYHDFIGAEP